MTTHIAAKINGIFYTGAKIRSVVISGNVTVDGTPVERDIVVFKDVDLNTPIGRTTSNSEGNFSLSIIAGRNDYATVICLNGGELYENSSIFAHISLAD